jgi:hypothetical protein
MRRGPACGAQRQLPAGDWRRVCVGALSQHRSTREGHTCCLLAWRGVPSAQLIVEQRRRLSCAGTADLHGLLQFRVVWRSVCIGRLHVAGMPAGWHIMASCTGGSTVVVWRRLGLPALQQALVRARVPGGALECGVGHRPQSSVLRPSVAVTCAAAIGGSWCSCCLWAVGVHVGQDSRTKDPICATCAWVLGNLLHSWKAGLGRQRRWLWPASLTLSHVKTWPRRLVGYVRCCFAVCRWTQRLRLKARSGAARSCVRMPQPHTTTVARV